MKIIGQKYFYWFISFSSITIILTSIYYTLGGFDEIKIVNTGSANYAIAGQWLKGEVSKNDEHRLFNKMRETIISGKLEGDLCILDYKSDTLSEGEMLRYVGIILKKEISAIPPGFEVVEINNNASYMAALTMHPLVMPNTEKIEGLMSSAAINDGIVLLDFTLEIFYPDNSVIVQMFAD